MANVLLISHEPEAAPALIGKILAERGHHLTLHVVLEEPDRPNTAFPDPVHYDMVVAFGSFANAYDPKARVWVEPEVEYLRLLLDEDVPYLGVCFGGQLLAEAIGGHVEKAPAGGDEIGLINFTSTQEGIPLGPWFSWHEDRMVLPSHTQVTHPGLGPIEVLASNEHAVQLYRTGRAVGTQFHPEADIPTVSSWIAVGGDHIPAHTSGEQLLDALGAHHDVLRENCERLVDWFLAEIVGPI